MARPAVAAATLTAHHDCEFREVLDRVGDKWSLLVIAMLEQRPTARARFSELKLQSVFRSSSLAKCFPRRAGTQCTLHVGVDDRHTIHIAGIHPPESLSRDSLEVAALIAVFCFNFVRVGTSGCG